MIRVLVVDDEVPIRQWLEFCISKLDGYQVVGTAANGAEGYSLYRKTMPEVVITDIRMPVMDGLEMLRMIKNLNGLVRSVVLTSHEDFEYVREALKAGASDYILKTEITEERLREMLDKVSSGISGKDKSQMKNSLEELSDRNQYLRSLVLHDYKKEITEKILVEYDIFFNSNGYVAIDMMTKEEALLKISLPEESFLTNVMKIPLQQNHVILLGNFSKNCPPADGKRQELLMQYCQELLKKADCRIGCSDIYNQASSLGWAMRQAYDRANLGFYYPYLNIFSTQKVGHHRIENGEKYKIRFTRELINQNYKKALEIKEEMTAEIQQNQVTDIEYIKKLYLFFLTSLFHMTQENERKVEEQLEYIGEQIAEAATMAKLNQIMDEGVEICGAAGTEEYSVPVRNAIYYMEEHFAESLSLSDVASYVNLSSEYLSRLFKEETGVKFVVYLNNLRLKNALYLLETTQMKVYEVAEQTGYSNLSYFSTVFKKKFGQNPFDYKNSYSRKEQAGVRRPV